MSYPEISLVVPVYNESVIIDELFQRTTTAMKTISEAYEVICVNDGSTDDTLQKLIQYHQKEPRFKVLNLSTNFGHQAAYTAGLAHAKGKMIGMMDGDLQDPPELLKEMHDKMLSGGHDIVYGKRISRKESFIRKLFINVFHFIFKHFSHYDDIENVGNFALFNQAALKAFLRLEEKNRYLPGLRFFVGFDQGFVTYKRQERAGGRPKMSLRSLFNLGMDAIFSFSNFPIKMCLYLGALGIISFIGMLVYTLGAKFLGVAKYGWSSTILSIYFLASIQLLFIGILGEYIFRIYRETQNRPIYIVRDFYDGEEQ